MPSMTLYGRRWHLASDALPVLGLVLLFVAVALLIVFLAYMLSSARPQSCGNQEQYAVVYGMLAFFILNVFTSLALIVLGIRGTPFTPSKRWAMRPLMHFQTAKWVAGAGFLAFCVWAVQTIPPYCWSSGVRTEIQVLLYMSIGIFALLGATMAISYNLLSDHDPEERWAVRLKVIAWLLGCYSTLVNASAPEESSSTAPLNELAGMFARFFGGTDIEKSDVAAGMLLAEVLQVQQRRTVIASKLKAAGIELADEQLQGKGNPSDEMLSGRASPGKDGKRRDRDGPQQLQRQLLGGSGSSRRRNDTAHEYGEQAAAAAADSRGDPGAGPRAEASEFPVEKDIQHYCEAHSELQQRKQGNQQQQGEGKGEQGQRPHCKQRPQQQQGEQAQGQDAEPGSDASSDDGGTATDSSDLATQKTAAVSGPSQRATSNGRSNGPGTGTANGTLDSDDGKRDGSAMQQQQAEQVVARGPEPVPEGEAQDNAEGLGSSEVRIDVDSPFYQWMQHVSEASTGCLTPSSWGPRLAPQLTPQQAAEIYTENRDYVQREVLQEAQRWAKHAMAAYGQGSEAWRRSRVIDQALPPVKQKLQQNPRRYVKQYVGAKKAAELTDEDVVYLSYTDRALGATPYIIALHRESKTVVLSVRGSYSMDDLITDLMDRPTDITGWLPDYIKQECPNLVPEVVHAHLGMWATAKATLTDLNEHQILPILLTGQPQTASEQQRTREEQAPDERSRQWQEMQQQVLSARGGRGSLRGGSQASSLYADRRGARGRGGLFSVYQSLLGDSLQTTTPGGSYTEVAAAGWPADKRPQQPTRKADEEWAPDQASAEAQQQQQQQGWGRGQQEQAQQGQPSNSHPGGPAGAAASHAAGGSSSDQARQSADRAAAGQHEDKGGEPLEEKLKPEDYQRLLQERGLDCRGWRLVVTGHSLGAACAALVAVHLRAWWPDTWAWCFSPPGGMVTENLSKAMQSFVTSTCVCKDIISRTGTLTFTRLVDQMIVGLARTRLSKTRLLLNLRSKSLREMPPGDVFYPLDQVPPEALGFALEYFLSKCRWSSLFMPMVPPGRVIFLRRLKDAASRKPRRQRRQQQWDAVWIEPKAIMAEGILLSTNQASDHYVERLLAVLEGLVNSHGVPLTGRSIWTRVRRRLLVPLVSLLVPPLLLPFYVITRARTWCFARQHRAQQRRGA